MFTSLGTNQIFTFANKIKNYNFINIYILCIYTWTTVSLRGKFMTNPLPSLETTNSPLKESNFTLDEGFPNQKSWFELI